MEQEILTTLWRHKDKQYTHSRVHICWKESCSWLTQYWFTCRQSNYSSRSELGFLTETSCMNWFIVGEQKSLMILNTRHTHQNQIWLCMCLQSSSWEKEEKYVGWCVAFVQLIAQCNCMMLLTLLSGWVGHLRWVNCTFPISKHAQGCIGHRIIKPNIRLYANDVWVFTLPLLPSSWLASWPLSCGFLVSPFRLIHFCNATSGHLIIQNSSQW